MASEALGVIPVAAMARDMGHTVGMGVTAGKPQRAVLLRTPVFHRC